jgi:hypothetical protein
MASPAAEPRRPSAPGPAHGGPLARARARRSNPLFRPQDAWRGRLQLLLALGLLAAALGCALFALGRYDADRGSAEALQSHLHPVNAQVLGAPTASSTGRTTGDPVAPVAWTGADGRSHQAVAVVPPLTVQGQTVQVWLDAADHPAVGPASPTASAATAVSIGLCALVGCATLMVVLHAVARSLLDRSALRGWERDWRATAPLWTGRR